MANSTSDGPQKDNTHTYQIAYEKNDYLLKASDFTGSRVNCQPRKVFFDATIRQERGNELMLDVKWKGRTLSGILLSAESNPWGSVQPAKEVSDCRKRKSASPKQHASPRERKQCETYSERYPHTGVNACNIVESKLRSRRGVSRVGSTPPTSDVETHCLSRRKGDSNKITEKDLYQENTSSDSITDDSFDEHQTPSCNYWLKKEPYSPKVKSDSRRKGNSNNITEKGLDQKNRSSDSIKDDSFDEHQTPSCSYWLKKEPYLPKVKSDSRRKGNSSKITEKGLDQKNRSSDSIKDDSFDEHQTPSCRYWLKKEPYSQKVKSDSTRKGTHPIKKSSQELCDNTLIYDLEDYATSVESDDPSMTETG